MAITPYTMENNVRALLAASITNADTSITINNATGIFRNPPSPISAGKPGMLTLADSLTAPTAIEIITYTGVVDNLNGTRTLTGVTRAREGTTAQAWASGTQAFQATTAALLQVDPGLASAAAVAITGGTLTGVTVSGNGSGLTDLNASNLASGTVPTARLSANLQGWDAITTASKLDATHAGAGGTAHAVATSGAAGFMAAGDKSKIDGIAPGATANSSDATLLARANHTGAQAISTVTGLQTALDGKAASVHLHGIARSATGGGTAAIGARDQCYATTGNVTVNPSVFSAGDAFSVYNDSASAVSIVQGTSMTLRLSGTATTGTRTLAARGLATVWFNAHNEAIVSGAGVT